MRPVKNESETTAENLDQWKKIGPVNISRYPKAAGDPLIKSVSLMGISFAAKVRT